MQIAALNISVPTWINRSTTSGAAQLAVTGNRFHAMPMHSAVIKKSQATVRDPLRSAGPSGNAAGSTLAR